MAKASHVSRPSRMRCAGASSPSITGVVGVVASLDAQAFKTATVSAPLEAIIAALKRMTEALLATGNLAGSLCPAFPRPEQVR